MRVTKYTDLVISGLHRKTLLACLNKFRDYGSLANYQDEELFFTGGMDADRTIHNSVYRFVLRSNKWEEAPPMNHARKFHGSCALKNKLFVFSGHEDTGENDP